jgi:Pentapeptide repeats (8 copies)
MARILRLLDKTITTRLTVGSLYQGEQLDKLEYNDAVFLNCTFENLGITDAVMTGGAIKQSMLDDVYARKGKFKKVDFTGTTFRNCNFDEAVFDDCFFLYCKFYNTLIKVEQIQRCLPKEANLRKDLAQNLKMNYINLGQKGNSDKFLDIEIEATQAELWAIIISKDEYHRKKYNRLDQITSSFKFIGFKISSFLWGYGHKVRKLIRSFMIVFLTLSAALFYSQQNSQEELSKPNKEIKQDSFKRQETLNNSKKKNTVKTMLVTPDSLETKKLPKLDFIQSIKVIASESVGYSTTKPPDNDSAKLIIFLAKLLGIIYLGLFVATLYRKIAR